MDRVAKSINDTMLSVANIAIGLGASLNALSSSISARKASYGDTHIDMRAETDDSPKTEAAITQTRRLLIINRASRKHLVKASKGFNNTDTTSITAIMNKLKKDSQEVIDKTKVYNDNLIDK